jgi:hypothetical protein
MSKSRCQRRNKRYHDEQGRIFNGYFDIVREAMVAGMRAKFPDEFTPEMEEKFREDTKNG